jgi:hypothetical protein
MQKKDKIFLIACSRRKCRDVVPARHLYISTLFNLASKYAERESNKWFILSAKWGLVEPDRVLGPYNQMLNELTDVERKKWARNVFDNLRSNLKRGDTVVFIAGILYREFLIPLLEDMGVTVEVPLYGLTIDKQVKWLHERIKDKQVNLFVK